MAGFISSTTPAEQEERQGRKLAELSRKRFRNASCAWTPNTGKFIWEHNFNVFHTDIVTFASRLDHPGRRSATGNIYAHGTQGLFFCFDKDGKVLWSRSLTEEYGRISGYGGRVTSPIVAEDLVIIGMLNSTWGDFAKGANRFLAMNKLTGEVVWWSDPTPGQVKGTYYSVPVTATINGQAAAHLRARPTAPSMP